MSEIDRVIVENISASKKKVGPLYPILVDSNNKSIDGDHRAAVDTNWETKKLDWVKTEKDRIIVRIHANVIRREIHDNERRNDINKLAAIAKEEGIKPGEISKKISEWVCFSDPYIRELLDPPYKNPVMLSRALKREEKKAGDLAGTPQSELPIAQMEQDTERNKLKEQAKKLTNWGGYENAIDLAVGILKKWETTWEKDFPDVARGLRSSILVITRFHNELKALRES